LHALRYARRIALGACLALCAVAVAAGCTPKPSAPTVTTATGVDGLRKLLPNLDKYEIESCSYSVGQSKTGRGLPSPSDTRVDLTATVTLSSAGAAALNADFTWAPVDRTGLPASVLAIAPEGDLVVSEDLNESFDTNARYVNAFVVSSAHAPGAKLYILATDIDHSIP